MSNLLPLPPRPAPWALDTGRDLPVYTRSMVGSEFTMQKLSSAFDGYGEHCTGVNFTSPLNIGELRDRARRALDKLRFVCPIIACTVEDAVPSRWIYTPFADREAWLNLAFVVEERGASLNLQEFVQSINLKRLPYNNGNGTSTFFRAYLLTTSKEGNEDSKQYGLYFHSAHFITDGRPALRALNLMLEWMCGNGMEVTITPSEEWKNLPVDPITATGGPFQLEEWQTSGGTLFLDLFKALSTPSHTLLPPSRPLNMSDPLFSYTITLPEAETAAIVVQTKKIGVSVSTLLQVAHALAQFKMNPVPPGAEVNFPRGITIVPLECYMKVPIDPKIHIISSMTCLPSSFSMTELLMEHSEKRRLIMTAKTLQKHVDNGLANPCLPHVSAALETMAQNKESTSRVSSNQWVCVLTNLGVVENLLSTQLGEVITESIHFGARVGTCMAIHTWTMNSKLHFKVQGADAWGDECMKTLLKETVRIVLLVLDESSGGSGTRHELDRIASTIVPRTSVPSTRGLFAKL